MQIKGAQVPPVFNKILITISLKPLWSFTPQVTPDIVYRWPVLRNEAALICGLYGSDAGLHKLLLCWASSLYTAVRLNPQTSFPSYAFSNNKNLQQCVPDLQHYVDLPSLSFGEVALIEGGVHVFGQMYVFNMWRSVGNLDSSSGCRHDLRRPAVDPVPAPLE